MERPGDILSAELQRAKTPKDFSRAYRNFYRTADGHADSHIQEANVQLACGECSFCCRQWVRVLAHEVFAVVDHLMTLPESERRDAIQRLEHYHENTKNLDENKKDRQNMPLPCPFLVDGRCSVYSVRPSNCRAFHSLDRNHCEGCLTNPEGWPKTPMDGILKQAWESMIKACDYAYFLNRFDQTTYDLVPACLAALSNPSLRRRWVSKKKALLTYDT